MIRAALRPLAGSALGAVLVMTALASSALAATYPPGPGGAYPDTLTIINLRHPAAVPHPQTGDVVLGIGGIITGFAPNVGTYGFYMQMTNGLPYSGIAVFTGNVDQGPGSATNLQVGDSVVVYGKVQHFSDTEGVVIATLEEQSPITPEGSNPNGGGVLVRIVSRGNPMPPTHIGTLAELETSGENAAAQPWLNMLVRLPGPLTTVAAGEKTFYAMDPACVADGCDRAYVDGGFLADVPPPPAGTLLTHVDGIFDLRQGRHQILLRDADDLGIGSPPSLADAFPIYDNDLPGSQRRDSLMVVFDRPVEEASAENVANYSLASGGAIDGALRLDAPDDHRVVLLVRNGLNDGAAEAITASGVKSVADGTAMPSPQTLHFFNGVLELDKVNTPDPAALAGTPCEDRSRFSGAGGDPGGRASFTGTVTGAFGDYYALQDVPSQRAGLWVHLPGVSLVPGEAYVLVGALRELSGETQGVNIVYVRGLGAGPTFVPSLRSVRVVTDDTCDPSQVFLTGEDLEGMLVTVDRVVVLATGPAGASFMVAIPGTIAPASVARPGTLVGPQDQILIARLGDNFDFAAVSGRVVTVTGVLGRVGEDFAIFPRSDSDIVDYGPVPTFSLPLDVSKSATQSRDPDIVLGKNGELFMTWGRVHHETVHALSLDLTLNWSTALPVMHQGVQPSVAVSPSNKIGVLGAGADALFFKQSTDGGHHMDPLVTPIDGFATRYPALTVGEGEHFHAAWERTGAGIFYSRSLTGGADFSAPFPIALNGDTDTHTMARIAASAEDQVYVFWQHYQPGEPGVQRVMYRRSLDGGATFSNERRVRDESNPLTSTMKLAVLGDAQVGPDGDVYVLGLDEEGGVAFLRSTNDGFTFGLVGYLPDPAARGGLCPKSFAVGADGSIHALIGVCGSALYYPASADGGATWGPAVNVTSPSTSEVGEPRGAKVILDGTGTPVIVWFSSVGGSTEIYSSRLLN